jgi:hypothetical protein
MVRRRLNLKTQKSNGVYIIAHTEQKKLKRLYDKYGLTDRPLTDADI